MCGISSVTRGRRGRSGTSLCVSAQSLALIQQSVIFAVQTSMNFNASVCASNASLERTDAADGKAVTGMEAEFGISAPVARIGQGLFLICYGFGCELWAPWSEEFGRKWILQASLFLVNIVRRRVA